MHVLVCNGQLWVPTSGIPNNTYIQHIDPSTYQNEYGVIVSCRWHAVEEFHEYLLTGKFNTKYHAKADIDLGVTFGHDGKLRAWHWTCGRVHSRLLPLNDRMPRMADLFQDGIQDLDIATTVALQQFAVEGERFDGGFLGRNTGWQCDMPALIDFLYRNTLNIRPSSEWACIDLLGLKGDFKPIPVIVGINSKKG